MLRFTPPRRHARTTACYAPACAPAVPSCATCAPQVVQYTPAAAVAYRPVFGFGYSAATGALHNLPRGLRAGRSVRRIQPVRRACGSCAAPCSTCVSPCTSCAAPCTSCASPCTSCGSSCTTYLPPASVVPATPAIDVPAPAAAGQPARESPAGASGTGPGLYGVESAPAGNSPSPTPAPPKTYQDSKPSVEPPVPVQPQQEKKKSEVNPTSFPPRLIDPQNRTAMLPIRQAVAR